VDSADLVAYREADVHPWLLPKWCDAVVLSEELGSRWSDTSTPWRGS
jgi:hypothetical protein